MTWPAIDTVRGWVSKRQGLLTGLVGVAVEEAVDLVPGGKLALKIVGEVAKYGVQRLADPNADVPDVKPVGQAFTPEQLAQINAWLEMLAASYSGLLDRLEALPLAVEGREDTELILLVRQALDDRAELRRQFDAHADAVRLATLSLARIEERLDAFFREQCHNRQCLEDIKAILVELLARGSRDGLRAFIEGRFAETCAALTRPGRAPGTRLAPPQTLLALSTAATRDLSLPVWRSLPRGLVVDRRYRIETEVGRGGMASVYRAIGVDWVNRDRAVALKVPAADLLADPAARGRFVTEIQVAQKLSGKHPAIVETLGYAVFDDPHSGRELYGLVLEFIDGPTLAHFLTQRQAKDRPLEPREILHVLKPVCEALEYAHSQGVCHRDIKPHNVLLTFSGRSESGVGHVSAPFCERPLNECTAKLADFGIARVLEDARATVTGQADLGTLAYMPPDRDFDARSDVYLLGNLLLELLTFDPRGDVEARADCPPGWAELVADSMNRLKSKRPQTARDFLARLEGYKPPPPPPPPPPPRPEIVNSLGMKLVLVPRGTFWMGDRGSQRQMEIPHDFYLGIYPVTQQQWQDVMGSNPSWFSRSGGGATNVKGIPDAELKQFPVEKVSFQDVQEFLNCLNEREAGSGFLYRLPTEAEWEYACRARGYFSRRLCLRLLPVATHQRALVLAGQLRQLPGAHHESGLVQTEPAWYLRHARQRLGVVRRPLRGGGLGPGVPGRQLALPRPRLPGVVPVPVLAVAPALRPGLSCRRSSVRRVGQGGASTAWSGGRRAVQGSASFWCFCLDYLEHTNGASPGGPGRPGFPRAKVDYKEVLKAEDFAVFAKLRELRKEIAQVEAVPVYAIFTNEQLAQMVQGKATTKEALEKIAGVGDARIDKYGERFLGLLARSAEPSVAPEGRRRVAPGESASPG